MDTRPPPVMQQAQRQHMPVTLTPAERVAKTPEYRQTYQCWQDMKQRCTNPNTESYKHYGARGIVVCEHWQGNFQNFLADMGVKPKGLSIERLNNDGNYEPENCIWADQKTQHRNRRVSAFLEYAGKRLTITEWAARIGRHPTTINSRLKRGMSLEEVLSPNIWTPNSLAVAKELPETPNYKRCTFCKCWDSQENLRKHKNASRYYHRVCVTQYYRDKRISQLENIAMEGAAA